VTYKKLDKEMARRVTKLAERNEPESINESKMDRLEERNYLSESHIHTNFSRKKRELSLKTFQAPSGVSSSPPVFFLGTSGAGLFIKFYKTYKYDQQL
jgi:hypothetical protein